jgi:DNA-binding MarR family transcriptional regulator
LDALEGQGLLRRDRHQADRRQRLVTLTSHGEARLANAIDATEQVEKRVFARLSTSEFASYYDATLATYLHIADSDSQVAGDTHMSDSARS